MQKIAFSSVQAAFALIEDGNVLVTAMAASEPQGFFQNAKRYLAERRGVVVYCANPSMPYDLFEDETLLGKVEIRPMFLTTKVRNHRHKPHVHYVPQHLSHWTRNLGRNPIDVFWGSCSLPNAKGFVSLGASVCYESEVIRQARHVILEVNPAMPSTYGSTWISADEVDVWLSSEHPLPSTPQEANCREDREIAAWIGELVPDGATLQLGIGGIPNALAEVLENRRDLGVHTEMINDTIRQLAEKGVINGRRKTLWPGKIIGSFAFGSEDLYRFIADNPEVELHPASQVNDGEWIRKNERMISINTAIEIDITGQVCSESLGHVELTGVGGATDTHVGAQKAKDGRGIIALRSLTGSGQSKIVAELHPGAKVSVNRNDIDTVISEYGIADLKGKTVAERARLLIGLAHPNARPELSQKAKEFGYF